MSVNEAVDTAADALSTISLKGMTWSVLLNLVLTVLICLVAIKLLTRITNRLLEHSRLEHSLVTFLQSLIKILLWFVAILIILSAMNVDVTSLIALLSVAGLAISLALQNTLSNLAGGIQLLVTKPFVSGDYVETGSNSGTVRDIGLAYTTLVTPDNKVVFVPNSEIAGARIVNYNGNDTRRVEVVVTASYDAPIQQVKDTIRKLVAADGRIKTDPAPFVRVSNYKESSIEYTIRVWCDAGNYWDVYFDLMDNLKPAFDAAGIEMTYDHLNVHVLERK